LATGSEDVLYAKIKDEILRTLTRLEKQIVSAIRMFYKADKETIVHKNQQF